MYNSSLYNSVLYNELGTQRQTSSENYVLEIQYTGTFIDTGSNVVSFIPVSVSRAKPDCSARLNVKPWDNMWFEALQADHLVTFVEV